MPVRTLPARLALGLACLFVLSSGVALGSPAEGGGGDTPTLRSVLAKIENSYVDPSRVDANRMLWSAAAALDREIPEVLLESQPGAPELRLRVAGESRTFPAADVRSISRLTETLREVLRFVEGHLPASDDRSAAEYAAINGILDSLDPHSILFTPAEARTFDSQIDNTISGVGMVMDFHGSVPSITAVMKGGAALEAGVGTCDRLLAVDGVSTEGRSIDEVISGILGPVGTEVWLTFDRDRTGLRDLLLIRRKIILSSVSSRMLEGGVGFIEIQNFARRTALDVETAITELKKSGANAWVVDLRRNPGGLMDEAVRTASLFISSGPIVSTVGSREREVRSARREHSIPAEDGPLTVLVSESTASAAEVLAGALQNRNRAVVLGRTSYGKGTVQVLTTRRTAAS